MRRHSNHHLWCEWLPCECLVKSCPLATGRHVPNQHGRGRNTTICPDRCMQCPPKPANQMCGGTTLGIDTGKGRCSGQATGIKWTDRPSFTAKNVASGQACCATCVKSALCRRYQFSAAAGVGCQLFYSKAPAGKPLTKRARGYVLGKSEWTCRRDRCDELVAFMINVCECGYMVDV